MLRQSGKLAAVLGLAAISMIVVAWFDRLTAHKAEELRLTRSELQTLEQQMHLLKSPQMQQTLEVLDEDLDALRIRLVEVLMQLPRPAGVLAVEYEHAVLPQSFDEVGLETVGVLRLELSMVVQHAIAFLEMMARIDEAIPVWPHELQACRIHRTPQEQLQLACVLDFYHWKSSQQQAATDLHYNGGVVAGAAS